MNVALGGTLHRHVHELDGYLDHREQDGADFETQYAPAHSVALADGGLFQSWLGESQLQVNSLHWQGVKALAKHLSVEAVAPDGLIEGFSLLGHSFLSVCSGILSGGQQRPYSLKSCLTIFLRQLPIVPD